MAQRRSRSRRSCGLTRPSPTPAASGPTRVLPEIQQASIVRYEHGFRARKRRASAVRRHVECPNADHASNHAAQRGGGVHATSLGPELPGVRVEVLYFDGCPSHEALLPRLRGLIAEAGVAVEIAPCRVARRCRTGALPWIADSPDRRPRRRSGGGASHGLRAQVSPLSDRGRASRHAADAWIRDALESRAELPR
jgi:hypothetical protein